MSNERRFYVYAHKDQDGRYFYIGKGTGRRAWSRNRDQIWQRYVAERSGGTYEVEILADGLLEGEALAMEDRLISEYRQQLVNWSGGSISIKLTIGLDGEITFHDDAAERERRQERYDMSDAYWTRRKESQRLNAEAKALQKNNPEGALDLAKQALALVYEYGDIIVPHEVALVEELYERTKAGDVEVIYRMTLILKDLGQDEKLVEVVDDYLKKFPDDKNLSKMKSVVKNRDKAATRISTAGNTKRTP